MGFPASNPELEQILPVTTLFGSFIIKYDLNNVQHIALNVAIQLDRFSNYNLPIPAQIADSTLHPSGTLFLSELPMMI